MRKKFIVAIGTFVSVFGVLLTFIFPKTHNGDLFTSDDDNNALIALFSDEMEMPNESLPSQPSNLRASVIGETAVTLQWSKPTHLGENIVSYELYWNDTYAKEKHHRRIAISEQYTLTGLYPYTLYYVWLAARSQRGEGATTPPISVRTKPYVPDAPPRNVTVEAVSPTSIRVSWEPPPVERSNGKIMYYKLQVVEAGRSDSEAYVIKLKSTYFTIDELKRWTEYRIWVLAGTFVGDGPTSYPITVRTHEYARPPLEDL